MSNTKRWLTFFLLGGLLAGFFMGFSLACLISRMGVKL